MNTRETWPCGDCGHKHYPSQECADHSWTDHCPYEGLDCPSAEERARPVPYSYVAGESP